MSNGRVGAVIVNYNAGADLTTCVAGLREQGVNDIAVSDNGSQDNSLAMLAEKFPDVPVHHLPNPGYGSGMNYAARTQDNEMIFVMNPDAEVRSGAIKMLLERMDSDPKIAVIGPRIENEDGSLYPSARRFPSFKDGIGHAMFGMFRPDNPWSSRYKMLDWGHNSYRDVDWVSGAAMFCRREAFDGVNGFDDDYWLYMEDVDLCWRMRRSGWKIVYDPEAVIVHVGGTSTSKSATPFKFVKAHHRSLIRYHAKTAQGVERFLFPFVLGGMVLRLPVAWARTKLAARKKA